MEHNKRVILHLDLDCFYAQVEGRRLGIDPSAPLGVQQWGSLIAVNYPAKNLGVVRGKTAKEARTACPGIKLVHVEIILPNGTSTELGKNDVDLNDEAVRQLQINGKVSLQRYRDASVEVFKVLSSELPFTIEKASIDEAFIDVTQFISEESERQGLPHNTKLVCREDCAESCHLTDADEGLKEGAWLAERIRNLIKDRLHLVMSAGVGRNKALAKMASGFNKPDGIAIFPDVSIATYLPSCPVHKLRGIGYKTAEGLQADLGISTVQNLIDTPLPLLAEKYGSKTAQWLYNLCRGEDNEEVKGRSSVKSLIAAKSFGPHLKTMQEALKWVRILANEMEHRLSLDRAEHNRVFKTLTLTHRSLEKGWHDGRSKSCPFPHRFHDNESKEERQKIVFDTAVSMLEKAPSLFPISRLMLSATGPEEAPSGHIDKYFSVKQVGSPGRPTRENDSERVVRDSPKNRRKQKEFANEDKDLALARKLQEEEYWLAQPAAKKAKPSKRNSGVAEKTGKITSFFKSS